MLQLTERLVRSRGVAAMRHPTTARRCLLTVAVLLLAGATAGADDKKVAKGPAPGPR